MNPYNPQAADRSTASRQRVAFDNLLRRELKIGDPSDPDQIARALADRYRGDTRAQAITGEAQGLPFLNTPSLPAPMTAAPTATNLDLEQAKDDVRQDLQKLLQSNYTKDVRPELEGWQQSIAQMIDEGVSSAGQGLDAYSRDRAFAMRRQIGEYARLARLIGALTPELNEDYRNLAQSLDEVCAVLLVLMGEALANNGFAGGHYLLQLPYSELQARRDAVLVALRNMSGAAQESLNQGTWPRGLDAYRQLYSELEASGQTELRSLLSESELARAMDQLIELAGGGSTSGMRRIGATAWGPLNRFQRFVQITLHLVQPQSPSLTAFQEGLQLFIDGFRNSGGFRLLRISRPTILLYGLYGATELSRADQRLIDLVNHRGRLASLIDCLTRCVCDIKVVKGQIVLDKLLFDVDRAIDLYAVGEVDLGQPEVRAAAYGRLIQAARDPKSWATGSALPNLTYLGDFDALATSANTGKQISLLLDAIAALLLPDTPASVNWESTSVLTEKDVKIMRNELAMQLRTDLNWRPVVEQMSSGCIPPGDVFNGLDRREPFPQTPANSKLFDPGSSGSLAAFQFGGIWLADEADRAKKLPLATPRIPRDVDTSWDELVSGDAKVFRDIRNQTGAFAPSPSTAATQPGTAAAPGTQPGNP
jgi:hypothetical protein